MGFLGDWSDTEAKPPNRRFRDHGTLDITSITGRRNNPLRQAIHPGVRAFSVFRGDDWTGPQSSIVGKEIKALLIG